jgi:hypothetical protein
VNSRRVSLTTLDHRGLARLQKAAARQARDLARRQISAVSC